MYKSVVKALDAGSSKKDDKRPMGKYEQGARTFL